MQIRDVIGGSERAVLTVHPSDTIADTVDMLTEHKIGAVVVTKDQLRILGIISERDVVRHLAHEQEGTLRLKVEDLMTENVQTCTLDDDIYHAKTKMIEGRFRHMPVVTDAGNLCAIVSLGDLVNARLAELETQNQQLRDFVGN